jgi:hypothetical protein
MLLQFKVSNYRCFADETTLDLTASTIKEHKDSLIDVNGVNVLPLAAVYGANASGKSSLFMAMEAMRDIIVNKTLERYKAIRQNEPTASLASRFLFDDDYEKKPTEFEMCFIIDGAEYRYGFAFSEESIISEYLYKKKVSKHETIEKMMYERTSTETTIGDKIPEKTKNEIEYCASMCSDASLLIADIGFREKDTEMMLIFKWFLKLLVIRSDTYYLNDHYEQIIGRFLHQSIIPHDLIMFYLKDIDPCIVKVEGFIEDIKGKQRIYKVKTTHLYNGSEKEIPLSFESDGTKKYLALLFSLLMVLLNGGQCCIDELDSKLHPLILRKIVRMFSDKSINTKGAQLIFSAHNIINLDSSDLRRDEIWFVEKSDHKSTLYSLHDFEDEDGSVRSDLNYGKHYLSGRFGAVPFQD